MLTAKECIEILNDGSETNLFSNDEVLQIRDFLSSMADIAYDTYCKQKTEEIRTNELKIISRKKSDNLLSS